MKQSTTISQKAKKFSYTWTEDIFLLHIQLTHPGTSENQVTVTRQYEDGSTRSEIVKVKKEVKSHRFMVSRSHPREKAFIIEYSKDIVLEAFKLDDRAYYPTESFYVG